MRINPINKNSVADFLAQIKRRTYIIEQCLQKVPQKLSDCRFLFEFALRGTDLGSLSQLENKSPDELRFLPEDSLDQGKNKIIIKYFMLKPENISFTSYGFLLQFLLLVIRLVLG